MNGLSDEELDIITDLARPLPVDRRSEFLAEVIAAASKHEVVGPGLIARIAATIQKTYFFTMAREPGGSTRQQARRR
jgi:hypothetical protein